MRLVPVVLWMAMVELGTDIAAPQVAATSVKHVHGARSCAVTLLEWPYGLENVHFKC